MGTSDKYVVQHPSRRAPRHPNAPAFPAGMGNFRSGRRPSVL